MARIYPQWIPDSERDANPGRRAEYLVYDCFSDQLGDEWLVLYSQAIKWMHPHGVGDREADFIVAHPDLGVVMIEVKGGGIEREGGIWYSTPLSQLDRPRSQRQRYPIKDPYQQATGAAKAYERKLDDYISNQTSPRSQRFPERVFKIATAVCFPDIEIPTGFHSAADALPELTFSQQDLPNLKNRLYQIFKLYQGHTGQPPGPSGLELLKTVLARDWHIESFLAYEFKTAEQRYKKLTEEQFQLLYNLESNQKMLIAGCAGSGKTMLAAEKARRLADQGLHVLYVCFNVQLAQWLEKSSFKRDNIKVAYFHDLCRWAASQTEQVDLPGEWSADLGISKQAYYAETMPEALMVAAEELDLTFDTIIVDEGQDFEESWFTVLQDLLRDQDQGIFYVFFDDNQKVYGKKRTIPFQWPTYRLTRNMRNTNPVFKLIQKYYHEPQKMQPSGVMGLDPWFIPFENSVANPIKEYELLQSVLAQLVEQRIPLSDIAILTPKERKKSLWSQIGHYPSKFRLVWQLETTDEEITCSTIRTFKGLERPVIILTELHRLESWEDIDSLLYVGISRAKTHLIVIGDLPGIPKK